MTREPYFLSFAEIASLTDYQINSILFAEDPFKVEKAKRDKEIEAKTLSYKQLFWMHWTNHGKTEEEIQARWDARQQAKKKRRHD